MNDQLNQSLPIFYRLDLSQDISLRIKQSVSFNIAGIPAVGKTSYLDFFIHNIGNFMEDGVHRSFVTINLRAFYGKTMDEFTLHLADKLDINDEYKSGSGLNLLEEYSKDKCLYFIIRYLDELRQEVIEEVLNLCIVLRDEPFNINFVFVSRKPLANTLTNNPVINSRLLGTQEIFLPDNMQELWVKLDRYEDLLDIELDNTKRFDIHTLSGGHGGYLQSILYFEKNGELEEVLEKDLPSEFKTRSQEILSILTESEPSVMEKIAKNKDAVNLEQIPENLLKLGLVIIKDEKPKIFSSILERYLVEEYS